MQIREGAYYITRDGYTVGPAKRDDEGYPWNIPFRYRFLAYNDDGTIYAGDKDLDLVAEAHPLWRDMTPEQKGALLLAHHEGKVVEYFNADDEWDATPFPAWSDSVAYRIRPEPKRETVTLHGAGYEWGQADLPCDDETHCITFDLIDGEPDCASIKMEKV